MSIAILRVAPGKDTKDTITKFVHSTDIAKNHQRLDTQKTNILVSQD